MLILSNESRLTSGVINGKHGLFVDGFLVMCHPDEDIIKRFSDFVQWIIVALEGKPLNLEYNTFIRITRPVRFWNNYQLRVGNDVFHVTGRHALEKILTFTRMMDNIRAGMFQLTGNKVYVDGTELTVH